MRQVWYCFDLQYVEPTVVDVPESWNIAEWDFSDIHNVRCNHDP